MSILIQCPICRRKQAITNKRCSCGEDLVKAKKAQRVKYWISYRLPNGKQKREYVGHSLEEAKDADGKRRAQKREGRIFDVRADHKLTFSELTKWFFKQSKVKVLKSSWRYEYALNRFNEKFGERKIGSIKSGDLEDYQTERKAQGIADATIDQEVGAARTAVKKAFENDLLSGEPLRVFHKVTKLLKPRANKRDRIIEPDEFRALVAALPLHLKPIIATAYFTGMRKSEILNLTWDKVKLKEGFIKLDEEDTKDKEPREIPLNLELIEILKALPRGIHTAHVFLFRGKPIQDIRTGLQQACQSVNIAYGRECKEGFVFHDLRHSFNTLMRKAGISESVIMAITGHSTREMFDRYNTVDLKDKQKAVDIASNFFTNVDQTVDQKKKKRLSSKTKKS